MYKKRGDGEKDLEILEADVVGPKEFPDYGILPRILNQEIIGSVKAATREEQRKIVNQGEGLELMREYGFSLNPITARSRVVTVLMKMEELAMRGDIKAAQIFLERVAGKVTQTIAIGKMKYAQMTDAELIALAQKKTSLITSK